ncbi:MAG: helix-turn-helix transcriptional regulator [Acidobacteriales bacterium]|nr:helix-turn-helix transcriptional regulator [Terriglobales bacterium]
MGSKVSRSYLSRIENGQMTPSLGTLEKWRTH